MNVIAAAKAFNQKAVYQNWHQFCDPTLSFSETFYTRFLSIWQEHRGDRVMPSRSQITPRDLKDFLRNIILVQRESEGERHYRWRLIGTSVTDIVGHNTGKLFEESVPPAHLSRWNEVCDMILESKQPWRFLGRVHIQGREYLDAEHLYVPLANDNGEPSFVMGLCRYVPRRSESEEIWENEIASLPQGLL